MAKIQEQTTGQSTHWNHYMGRIDHWINHNKHLIIQFKVKYNVPSATGPPIHQNHYTGGMDQQINQ